MSLLPSSPEVSVEDDPRVVGLDSEDADALMGALSSDTAREVLAALHDEPAPPSQLADRVDTTLQNAQYHLERLSDAGAIEVVGTAYSEKGREMDVYAPADRPLVIFAGQEDQASGLRAALSRLIGGLAALLVGAVAIQEVFGGGLRRLVGPLGFGASGDAGGGGGAGGAAPAANATATPAPTGTPEPAGTPAPTPTPGADGGFAGGDGGGTVTPAATETSASDGGPSIFVEPEGTPTATPSGGDGGAATTGTPTAADTTAEAATSATATPAPTPTGDPVATTTPAATPTPTPTNATATATETARTAVDAGAADAAFGLPPGVLFFLGGAMVLGVAVAMTYR